MDFGTKSAQAVLVDVADGTELATAVHERANGVIDERLPEPNQAVVLEHDWALQDSADYIAGSRMLLTDAASPTSRGVVVG